MSLMLFKYALPIVIGYVLCVGISGQLWPLSKPQHLIRRPSWFLGLWAGSAVALTLMLALNLAYHLPTISISSLAIPSLSLLAAAIVPGFLVFLWYRRHISQELIFQHRKQHSAEYTQQEIAKLRTETMDADKVRDPLEATWSESFEDIETIVEATDRTPANETESMNDTYNSAFDNAYLQTREKLETVAARTEEQLELDIDVAAPESEETDDTVGSDELQTARLNELLEEQLLAREEEIRTEMAASADQRLEQLANENQQKLSEALQTADQESKLREEVENNLRITRKAMVQLESRTRKLEMTKADELIAMEQQLDEQIRKNSKLEAALDREQQQINESEENLKDSRQELLEARTELRKNTAARAKALASANKAVAFARQAVDARAQTESQLSSLKDRVVTQQTTISSLIKALDTEKTNHKEELAFLNAQISQRDGELDTIANGGDAANQTLTTRLVKKVAKPRSVS